MQKKRTKFQPIYKSAYGLTLGLCAMPYIASAINLGMPLACEYGKECYISRYFDHAAEDEPPMDYACSSLSERGYVGVDFMLSDRRAMERGVTVLASDGGVVEHVRDGMQDVDVRLVGEEAVRGRECGNGVIVRHIRGYATQYCHLKKGSVELKPGDVLERGDRIGDLGMSGKTSYPHLQFIVLKGGKPIDPFTGEDPITESPAVPCGTSNIYPLWDRKTEKRLSYIATAILDGGFSRTPPNERDSADGKYRLQTFPDAGKFMLFWTKVFGLQDGDMLYTRLYNPSGELIKEDERQIKENKTIHFQYVGARKNGAKWPSGKYRAEISVLRDAAGFSSDAVSRDFYIEVTTE